jgi:hypothetical protein
MGELDPTSRQRAQQETAASSLCEDIIEAAQEVASSLKAARAAQERASSVAQRTMFGQLPYRLKVQLDAETKAVVTEDDEIIESSPTVFTATELWSIGRHGVEFFNTSLNRKLTIVNDFGFTVEPIFDQPSADEFS